MIDTLFLDLDDTILDFHKAEAVAIAKTFRSLDIEPSEENISLYSRINDSQWKRLEKGELTREEVLSKRFSLLFEALGIERSVAMARQLYETLLGQGHFFIDGAETLLRDLCGKYRIYIASNGTARIQKGRIESSGIAKYVDRIFISSEIGVNKPSKEFFDYCFDAVGGVDRERTLMVGDSLSSDILGGKNAGIKTCLYNPHKRENTTQIIPDYEIHNLSELPSLLSKI